MMNQMTVDEPATVRDPAQFFQGLATSIAKHPALTHPFLRRFAEASLDRRTLAAFAAQHYLYSKRFTRNLAAAISNLPDEQGRSLLVSNMYEEIGEPGRLRDRLHLVLLGAGLVAARQVGIACAEASASPRPGDVVEILVQRGFVSREHVTMALEIEEEQTKQLSHPALFRRFLRALELAGAELERIEPLPETARFIEEYDSVCRHGHWLESMGALGPGTECVVPALYSPIERGIARSGIVAPADYVFWTVHVSCDEGHGANIVRALMPYARTREQQGLIVRGAMRVLDARSAWFDGLERLVFGAAAAAG